MRYINKQKFLTELRKLLTFMTEEDRDTAIAMYDKMFQLSPDETMLINALVSPTRQAVQLARSYDSKKAADDDTAETAPYILKIKEIFGAALDTMPDADKNTEAEPVDEKETGKPEEQNTAEDSDDDSKAPKQSESSDQVDNFLKDFKISDAEIPEINKDDKSAKVSESKEKSSDQTKVLLSETADEKDKEPEAEDNNEGISSDKEKNEKSDADTQANNGKLSGASLALFLLIAIPLTAIGLIIVFAVAIGILAVSAAGFLMTVRILGAAFGSFKVFADVLVVTGTGFVLGALSILFLWTAVWLAVGVSAKMVNGIINLAIKICTKEDTGK